MVGNLNRSTNFITTVRQVEQEYIIVTDFLSINRRAYIEALDIFEAENTSITMRIIPFEWTSACTVKI